jgi:hypothetical protein
VDCTLKDALSAACQERLVVSVAELHQVTFVQIIFLFFSVPAVREPILYTKLPW